MNENLQDKQRSREDVVRILNEGGVGVIPTDTLYGLAARAMDRGAVARLYALKQREHKPGTIIAASTDQLLQLGVSPDHINKVKGVWPNSVSVETPLGPELAYLHQETGRQGFRVVKDAELRGLLEQTGPLVTSSANQPGEPVSETLEQAWGYFGNTVDFYLDGGDLAGRLPSTLIVVHDDGNVEIVREGAVKASELPPLG